MAFAVFKLLGSLEQSSLLVYVVFMYGVIYGLYEPDTDALRYIGQTTKTANDRLSNHMSPSGLNKRVYVACWLKGLVARGLRPVVRVLAEASDREELDRMEVEYIRASREAGARLVNLAPGGRVSAGYKKSAEACAKIAAVRRGTHLSKETKKKLAVALSARRLTDTHKKRIGAKSRGRVASQETREKQSRAKRNPHVSDAVIIRRRANGESHAQIGAALGVSATCIGKRLKKMRD